MHIGGIHIIFGLGFLLLTILLTTVYAYSGYLLIAALQHLIYKFKKSMAMSKYIRGRGPNPDDKIARPTLKYYNKKALYVILLSATIILSVVYVKQRLYWMGSGTAHHEAKEYFVAGQPAFGVRRIAELLWHPENPLVVPYTKLQEYIFQKGSALLPEDDGESAVWRNMWFFYVYTRASKRPYRVDDNSTQVEPRMIKMLDSMWETLEKMATKPYACKKAKRDYYLSFPTLLIYYDTYSAHYKGKIIGSYTAILNDQVLMGRKSLLLKWLDELDMKWDYKNFRSIVNNKYPGVAATKFIVQIRIVRDILLSKALHNQFSCEDPLVDRLHKMYQDAMSDDIQRNSFLLYKKKNRDQAKVLYISAVYRAQGSAGKYLLAKICGRRIPTEKNVIAGPADKLSLYTYSDKEVENVFRNELKIFIHGERND